MGWDYFSPRGIFRVYSPLALEVNKGFLIDRLGSY